MKISPLMHTDIAIAIQSVLNSLLDDDLLKKSYVSGLYSINCNELIAVAPDDFYLCEIRWNHWGQVDIWKP